MEDKFYTPKIDEFYIGFEFEEEFKNPNHRKLIKPLEDKYEWVKLNLDTSHSLSRITSKIKQNRIRVKYLDESDLIELGWNKTADNSYESNARDTLTVIRFSDEKGRLLICEESFSKIVFKGTLITRQAWIKNKSEMKKLMQMLNIKTTINKNEQ